MAKPFNVQKGVSIVQLVSALRSLTKGAEKRLKTIIFKPH